MLASFLLEYTPNNYYLSGSWMILCRIKAKDLSVIYTFHFLDRVLLYHYFAGRPLPLHPVIENKKKPSLFQSPKYLVMGLSVFMSSLLLCALDWGFSRRLFLLVSMSLPLHDMARSFWLQVLSKNLARVTTSVPEGCWRPGCINTSAVLDCWK